MAGRAVGRGGEQGEGCLPGCGLGSWVDGGTLTSWGAGGGGRRFFWEGLELRRAVGPGVTAAAWGRSAAQ